MYTVMGYQKNLTQEHYQKLEILYKALDTQDFEDIEKKITETLRWLLERNSDKEKVNPGDFSMIMLLEHDFDMYYLEWSYQQGKLVKRMTSDGGNYLLLEHVKNKHAMNTLLDEVFLYLEHDFYIPKTVMLQGIKEYEKEGTVHVIEKFEHEKHIHAA